jgi:hypothetical protein
MTTQTLRPKTPPYRDYAVATLLIVVVLVVGVLARDPSPQNVLLFGGLTLAILAALAVVGWLYYSNSRIVLEPRGIWHTSMFGRSRLIVAGSVSRVLAVENFTVTVGIAPRYRRSEANTFLLDAEGRTVLRLRASLWSPESMGAVAAAAGAPVTTELWADPASVRGSYPNAVGVIEAHPYIFGAIVGAATVVIVVVALVIVVLLSI